MSLLQISRKGLDKCLTQNVVNVGLDRSLSQSVVNVGLDKSLTQNVVNVISPALRPGTTGDFPRPFISIALNDSEDFQGKPHSFTVLKRGQGSSVAVA